MALEEAADETTGDGSGGGVQKRQAEGGVTQGDGGKGLRLLKGRKGWKRGLCHRGDAPT